MGAKPKKTGSAARVPAKKKPAPARRVPARKASSKAGRKARPMTVDGYVAGLSGDLAAAARRLRQVVLSAAPSATEAFKWGQPVYEDNGPFCYFKASQDHITFGFWRGTELDDQAGRLEGDGDRMKHLKIRGSDEVDDSLIAEWVGQAVDLNRRLGNPTRRAATQRGVPAEPAVDEGWQAQGEDHGEAQEIEPHQIESVQSIESAVEPGADRFQDDDSFGSPWKDSER